MERKMRTRIRFRKFGVFANRKLTPYGIKNYFFFPCIPCGARGGSGAKGVVRQAAGGVAQKTPFARKAGARRLMQGVLYERDGSRQVLWAEHAYRKISLLVLGVLDCGASTGSGNT